jgi:hypothetical protein
VFDKKHEFAKDLREVSTINFIDNKNVLTARCEIRLFTKSMKNAIAKYKSSLAIRTIALDEIFVAIRLVKLNTFNSAGIPLP